MMIELDMAERNVLVVGFGQVGRRKVGALIAAGAKTLIVDPNVSEVPPAGLKLVREPYHADHLAGIELVFAAAPAAINQQVLADARRLGIWANMATEPSQGDFYLPASWRDGPIAVSVSTGGISPALAATLRDRVAKALGPAPAILASVLAGLRAEVLAMVADPKERHRIMSSWADPMWLNYAESESEETLRERLKASMLLRH